MRKEGIWAIPFREADAFFRQQPDVAETETGFCFGGCAIGLAELPPRGEGFWRAPQTKVTMDGPEADLTMIYRRFFLRFLSAGG